MRRFSLIIFFLLITISSPLINFQGSSIDDHKQNSDDCSTLASAVAVSSAGALGVPQKQARWSYGPTVGTVDAVAVSPNEAYVFIGTSDGDLYLFNGSSNVPLHGVTKLGGAISNLTVSYDGKYVAAAFGNTVKVFNVYLDKLRLNATFHNPIYNPSYAAYQGIHSLAFSANGSILAVGTWCRGYYGRYSYVHLFNVQTNSTIWTSKISDITSSSLWDYVTVDISSDGQSTAASSTNMKTVYLFNRMSSTPEQSHSLASSVNSVSVSDDGKSFAAGSGNLVCYFKKGFLVTLWSVDLQNTVISVSISPAGTYVAAASGSYVSMLSNATRSVFWSYQLPSMVGQVCFSKNGQYVVSKSASYVHVFSLDQDGDTSTPATTQHDPLWSNDTGTSVRSISISTDARYTTVGSGNYVFLFDKNYDPDVVPISITLSNENPIEGSKATIYANITNLGNIPSPLFCVKFLFDAIWFATTEISSIPVGLNAVVSADCWPSPPGNHTIKVIVDSGNMLYESNETNNILTSKVVVQSVQFIDSGENPIQTSITQIGTVSSVSMSGDGYYAVAGTSDNYVHLLIRNHTYTPWSYMTSEPVRNVSISAEGTYIAAAVGNVVHIFSRLSSKPLRSFSTPIYNPSYAAYQGIHSLAFSANGSILAVGTWCRGYYGRYSYVHLLSVPSNITMWTSQITDITSSSLWDYVTVDISSDGNSIVAGSTQQQSVYFYFQQATPSTKYLGAQVKDVAIRRDGKQFVAAAGDRVYLFTEDISAYKWNHQLPGTVTSVSISDKTFNNLTYITATSGSLAYLLSNDINYVKLQVWKYNATKTLPDAIISIDGNFIIARSTINAYLFSRVTDRYPATPSADQHDPILSYDAKNTVNSISISSEGRYTIFGSGGKAFLFDVQHKADLIPTSISFSSDKPNEGEIITISAIINNTGPFKSYYTNVSFYNEQTLIGRVQIDPLLPNSSAIASLSYAWDFTSVYSLPAGAKKQDPSDSSLEESKLLKSLNLNGKGQVAVVKPGETISVDYTYQLWSQSNPSELDQLFFIYSWTPSWPPPDGYYYGIYHGGPGLYPGKSGSGTFTLTAPSTPGTYLLYWCFGAHYSIKQAVNEYKQQLTPSGHAKIIVTNETAQSLIASSEQDGNQTISVAVDPDNKIWESNRTNNQLTTTIYVNARPTLVTLYNPSDITATSMKLNWTKNTETDFAKYQIYKSTLPSQTGTLEATIQDQAKTSYVVYGLKGSTTYYFTVRTIDTNGAYSDSKQVSATTLPSPVTPDPTPVHLNNPSNLTFNSLFLTWSRNNDSDFLRYEVYLSNSSGILGSLFATINDQTQVSYNVTGLQPSTTYYFTVRTINQQGKHSDSNQVIGRTRSMGHDIAITNVRVLHNGNEIEQAQIGDVLIVEVTLENLGIYNETFDVAAYYDSVQIGTKTDVSLSAGATTVLTFTWNTTGIQAGNYYLKATATTVEGETDTANNSYTLQSIVIQPPLFWTLDKLLLIFTTIAGIGTAGFAIPRVYRRQKIARQTMGYRLMTKGEEYQEKGNLLESIENYANAYLANIKLKSEKKAKESIEQYGNLAKTIICQTMLGNRDKAMLERVDKIQNELKKSKLTPKEHYPHEISEVDLLLEKARNSDLDFMIDVAMKKEDLKEKLNRALKGKDEINVNELATQLECTSKATQKLLLKAIEQGKIKGVLTRDGQKFLSKDHVQTMLKEIIKKSSD